MAENILERNKLNLSPIQLKMARSGWGDNAVDKTLVEEISYLSDGLKVKGYLAYPKNPIKKYPCVIWCRGGFGNAGAIDHFNAQGIFGQLASWGYVVFAPQYRGNAGGEGHDEFGGGDLNDVLNLIPLADELDFADQSQWAIEGWSRGGMMTYLALTKTNIFKAAIVSGGLANIRCNADESKFMKRIYDRIVGKNKDEEFKSLCESRSIINFPKMLSKSTPLLILHGNNDNRVLPHDSLDLSYKLLEQNIRFRLVMYEGGDHFLKSHRNEINELRKNWLAAYLK